MRASDLLVNMLQLYEVSHIFGVPGDTSMSFYDALADSSQLQHIMCRDERSAGFMADAYARVSQSPGVVEGPSGGGAAFLFPALAESDGSSVPVIGLTSDIPRGSQLKGTITDLNQVDTFKPHTRFSHQLNKADMIPHSVRSAFRAATGGRMGASHLSLPEDILSQEVSPHDVYADSACARYPAWRCRPDPQAVEQITKMISQAKRPVILAGGGVLLSDASEQLVSLSEKVNIPVATSMDGKGAIPENHPLSLGVVGSNGGKESSNTAVCEADLIIAVGTKLNSTTTNGGKLLAHEPAVAHIDIDPMMLGTNVRTAVTAMADAQSALSDLAEAAEGITTTASAQKWIQQKASDVRQELNSLCTDIATRKNLIHPAQMVVAMKETLPGDAVVICDAGTPTPWMVAYYPTLTTGKRIFAARSHGSLGYAMPAALGADKALPDTPIFAMMGDGSFGMSIGEFETLVREGQNITVLHLNNDTYGWIKMLQKLYYDERYFSVDFGGQTDHAQVASAMGAQTHTAYNYESMETALQQSLTERISFIEVDIIPETQATPPVSAWQRDVNLPQDERTRKSY